MMREVPSGAADRLAYLLKLVAHGPDRFSLGDLAARARLPASTVHRLLQVMVRAGLVERGAHQTYRPGREFYAMASQLVARFDVIRSARPLLEGLVERWHETAVLCTYNPTDRRATIADVVMTPHPLRFAVEREARSYCLGARWDGRFWPFFPAERWRRLFEKRVSAL
jgi:DNA-binding IclR family transcriptional regulator